MKRKHTFLQGPKHIMSRSTNIVYVVILRMYELQSQDAECPLSVYWSVINSSHKNKQSSIFPIKLALWWLPFCGECSTNHHKLNGNASRPWHKLVIITFPISSLRRVSVLIKWNKVQSCSGISREVRYYICDDICHILQTPVLEIAKADGN